MCAGRTSPQVRTPIPPSGTGRDIEAAESIMGFVSVEKAIELIGTGETIQDAVEEALDRAQMSLEGITNFEVQQISGALDGGKPSYRVQLRVWFTLMERMHG
jgi:flavin-binding protein dodecin